MHKHIGFSFKTYRATNDIHIYKLNFKLLTNRNLQLRNSTKSVNIIRFFNVITDKDASQVLKITAEYAKS